MASAEVPPLYGPRPGYWACLYNQSGDSPTARAVGCKFSSNRMVFGLISSGQGSNLILGDPCLWLLNINDPGRARICIPRLRRPMPYPLGHRTRCKILDAYMFMSINIRASLSMYCRSGHACRDGSGYAHMVAVFDKSAEPSWMVYQPATRKVRAQCSTADMLPVVPPHSHTHASRG